jgi:hypothetical protein
MAQGRKTGGRDFRAGNPGRPSGIQEAVPRSVKASVRAILAEVVADEPTLLREAIRRGLAAPPPKSFPYLQMAAHYLDGKPAEEAQWPGIACLTDSELETFNTLLKRAMGDNENA